VNRRLADTRTGEGAPAACRSVLDRGGGHHPGLVTTAVSLGVTAVDPSLNGFVTAWPLRHGRKPTVSNLNPEASVTRPNLVNVRVGANRKVCLFSSGPTDLVSTCWPSTGTGSGARYAAVAPQRLLDSRVDGHRTHMFEPVRRDRAGELAARRST